jgi:hypothetical protein
MAQSVRPRSSSRIFISYRRTDSAGHAGRLHDSLSSRFGRDQVFKDVESIRPGTDFEQALKTALGQCAVLLALIGPHWLTPVGRRGKSRLDDPDDLVRRELETALQRRIRIFPVLLGTAQVPPAGLLPASLRAIATLQALPLRDDRWRSDAQALAGEIGRILGPGAAAPPPRTASGPTPSRAERRQQVEAASRQIDAHLEYNKAALQTRREAVREAIGLTRSELAASDRHTRSRERSMDQARKKLTAAPPAARESLLHIYARDDAAIAAQFTARGDALTRQTDVLLNGPGALAVAPQPFPDLPIARKPAPADPPRTTDTDGTIGQPGRRSRRRRSTGR